MTFVTHSHFRWSDKQIDDTLISDLNIAKLLSKLNIDAEKLVS